LWNKRLIKEKIKRKLATCIIHSINIKSERKQNMATEKSDLLIAGNIAKTLGVPDSKIKNAIKSLGIKPTAKKGVCCYYSKDAIAKIKSVLK
jgi:hypothetical protein